MICINSILPSCISQLHVEKNVVVTPKNQSNRQIRLRRNGLPIVHINNWLKTDLIFAGTKEEFLAITQTLTPTDRFILSLLIHFRSKGLRAFMTQEYIAQKIGRNATYVCERLNLMMKLGLLDIYHRSSKGKNVSNVYKVATHFFDANFWDKLNFIPAIQSMALGLLLLCPILQALPAHRPSLEKNPKLLNIKEFSYINNYYKNSKEEKNMRKEYTNNRGYGNNSYQSDDNLRLKSLTMQLHNVRSAERHCQEVEERKKLVAAEQAAGKGPQPMSSEELFRLFKC